jgi:enoyl-CoA hydratase
MPTPDTLLLTVKNHIAHVRFNRVEKANALNDPAWEQLKSVFEALDTNRDVRVIILSGEGKHFCSGIDLSLLMNITAHDEEDHIRDREKLRRQILWLQSCVSSVAQCSKPVLAAVSGGCLGAGVDIISACDMRYASEDAFFSIKEIDMGMVADLGTLQRLPNIIPEGIMRELAFTGRNVSGTEAEKIGLVNHCYPDMETMMESVYKIAAMIASKSPLSIRGTKHVLNYSRDHSISDGLNYIATWNAAMLISADLTEALDAKMNKRDPDFGS